MKKVSVFTSVVLATLLALCALTGCQSAAAPSGGQDNSQAAPAANASAPTTAGAPGTAEAAPTDELVTVKVGYGLDPSLVFEGGETIDNNSWTELYAENGIKLEIVYNVEASQKDEKLAQMVMSGDYPDFMNVSSKYYRDWASQGVFASLTEHFETYASDVTKEFYQTDYGKSAKDAAMVDGTLYSVPVISAGYDGLPLLWIRNDWLAKLGLEAPKTVDEFYEMARAFTEDDPDGDGAANTYGFILNGKDVFTDKGGFDQFMQMFGVVTGASGGVIPFMDDGGKAVYGGTLAEPNKQALEMLAQSYTNGYIPQDFITAGSEQVDQMLSSGRVGMVVGRMYIMGTPWKNLLATTPEADFIAVPLPGVTEAEQGKAYYTSAPGSFYCLSSKSDKAEEFFKIINLGVQYLGQPDTLSQADYEKYNGLAGKYTGWQLGLAAFGNPIKNLEALTKHQNALATGDTSALNAENARDFNAMKAYYDNRDRRSELSEEELSAFDSGIFFWSVWGAPQCGYKAIADIIDKGNIIYSAYEAPMTDSMIEYNTTLDTLAKETIIDIVTGNRPVDAWDEFLNNWNTLGGTEITADADAWYQSVK